MTLMIPGAWESRRAAAVPPPLPAPVERRVAVSVAVREPERPRPKVAGWIKVSIFAATLLAGMWLAMAAIHPLPF
jgi:hypothetical protein